MARSDRRLPVRAGNSATWQTPTTSPEPSPVTDATTDSPTPGPQPVITSDTRVKTNLQTIIAVGGFLGSVVIAATVWCTIMYLDVQQLKESAKAKDVQLTTMAGDISQMRDEVRRLSWIIGNQTAAVAPTGRGSAMP